MTLCSHGHMKSGHEREREKQITRHSAFRRSEDFIVY